MSITVLLLILANVFVSYRGLRDRDFMDRYAFSVDGILVYKQYYRIFTSSFLHTGWWHLFWNMFALFAFGGAVESMLSTPGFLLIYFASNILGDLFALFVHRHHGDYNSVGASASVNGVIFAGIAIFPGMQISLIILPMPAWLFGIAYVLVSIWAIRSRRSNAGHEAHLAGALAGMLIALLLMPQKIVENYPTILLIAVPTIAFIGYVIARPHALIIGDARRKNRFKTVDERYYEDRADKQKEFDRILDKINRKGMKSLTTKEKQLLEEYSRTIN